MPRHRSVSVSTTSVGLLGLVAATLASAGCADNADSRLLIMQNQVPGDGCVISATESEAFIGNGLIDATSPSLVGYLFTPLVKNFSLVADNISEAQRIAFLKGANVEIEFTEELFTDEELAAFEDERLTRFSTPFAAAVTPAGGTAGLAFEIVPRALLDEIQGKLGGDGLTLLRVRVQVFGDLGGGGVQSQWFDYPVTVCEGCLLFDNGACSGLSDSFQSRVGNPCNAGQDGVTDCCTDDSGGARCPATAPSTGN